MAPRTPYSENLANFVPATDVTISNEGAYDPFAKQNAELEALKAQTTAMNLQLQRSMAAQAAKPAYVPPALPEIWTPPASQSAYQAPVRATAPVYQQQPFTYNTSGQVIPTPMAAVSPTVSTQQPTRGWITGQH